MPHEPLVIGEPTQVEVGGKRFYRVDFEDGTFRHLRSVTTICKGARLPSYLDIWQEEQIEALGRGGFKAALNQKAHDGTLVHKFIEMHCDGIEVNRSSVAEISTRMGTKDGEERIAQFGFDDDTWPMYEAYLRWEERRQPEHIWQERVLYSLRYGYAGRSDRKIKLDGKNIILDYKSSKKVNDDHCEQGCAYLMANNEMGEECDGILILALGAENKQGYSEKLITNPYDIHNYFMRFYHKLNLINAAEH